MNRRPWLLVLLAITFVISPFLYPLLVSFYFDTPLTTVAKETLAINSTYRNIEVFILPVVLGIFTYFAHRASYFIVVLGSIFLLVRNFLVFEATNDSFPVSALVFMNLLFVFVIVYLSRRSTRALYFNSKMRWWETDPRYVVEWEGTLSRLGAQPTKVKIQNIAVGGAALETLDSGFQPHEQIKLDFFALGQSYSFAAGVVREKNSEGAPTLLGIQWLEKRRSADGKKMKKLIREIKQKGIPTTRPADRWQDFKSWISRPETGFDAE